MMVLASLLTIGISLASFVNLSHITKRYLLPFFVVSRGTGSMAITWKGLVALVVFSFVCFLRLLTLCSMQGLHSLRTWRVVSWEIILLSQAPESFIAVRVTMTAVHCLSEHDFDLVWDDEFSFFEVDAFNHLTPLDVLDHGDVFLLPLYYGGLVQFFYEFW